jgi:hypothetical protein
MPKSSVVDPWHFGTYPDADPDPSIRTSYQRIRMRIRMRIRKGLNHKDPKDPNPDTDPQHCLNHCEGI